MKTHKTPEPLETLRRRKPMTQHELAMAVGFSVVTIRNIESGRAGDNLRPSTMRALATFFDREPCDITEFLPSLRLREGEHCEDGD